MTNVRKTACSMGWPTVRVTGGCMKSYAALFIAMLCAVIGPALLSADEQLPPPREIDQA